jgi:recombination protein RecA
MAAKQSTQEKVLALLNKKFGEGSAVIPNDEEEAQSEIKEVCPTGISVVDKHVLGNLFGIGGLPFGRIIEVAGEEGSGKSSFLYSVFAQAQKAGDATYLLDAEKAFDRERLRTMNGDPEKLVICQPHSLEQAIEMILLILQNHDPVRRCVIGWDSLASSTPNEVMVAKEVGRHVGAAGRVTSQEVPKINDILAEKRAMLVIVNQLRDKPGVMFGPSTTTPGGRTVKFMASVRLQFFGGKALKDEHEDHVGKIVTVVATKTRLSAPFRKARVRFDYMTGWNDQWTVMEFGKTRGVITGRDKGEIAVGKAYELLGMTPPLDVSEDDVHEDTTANDDL